MSESRNTNLPKRFYANAEVVQEECGFAVRLDARALRTPGRRTFLLARQEVAEAVADEWRAQDTHVDPATMPLTRLCNTILDAIADDPSAVREDLKRYGETDLLFYRAEAPDRLVERQSAEWDPVLRWAESAIGGLFAVGSGVMHLAQPPETLGALASRLDRLDDAFEIAGLHQMTTLTGSLILALAVAARRLDADEAWRLAHLDEDWNIEQWGEDAEAAARRAARYGAMRAAAFVVAGRSRPPA